MRGDTLVLTKQSSKQTVTSTWLQVVTLIAEHLSCRLFRSRLSIDSCLSPAPYTHACKERERQIDLDENFKWKNRIKQFAFHRDLRGFEPTTLGIAQVASDALSTRPSRRTANRINTWYRNITGRLGQIIKLVRDMEIKFSPWKVQSLKTRKAKCGWKL